VARGPEVAKVLSLTELCGLRVKVETYIAPKGPLQCKCCWRFGHTQRNCSYAPKCVDCGDAHRQGRVRPQSSSLNAVAAGATTLPPIVVAVSWRRQGRQLQSARKGSAARRMASPRACRHPNRPQLYLIPNRRSWAQAGTTWCKAAASWKLRPRKNPPSIHLARVCRPGGGLPYQWASPNPVVPSLRW
jgi:hypothetical protein